MNLEGIVSKRKESPYRSGPTRDWLKIKTASWRAANRDRYEVFAKPRARSFDRGATTRLIGTYQKGG
jgi:ATP-dependent DNA ligase